MGGFIGGVAGVATLGITTGLGQGFLALNGTNLGSGSIWSAHIGNAWIRSEGNGILSTWLMGSSNGLGGAMFSGATGAMTSSIAAASARGSDLIASNNYVSVPRYGMPDDDGYITLNEANIWYRQGRGLPLYADLSKIDLSRISPDDFNGVGSSRSFNLLSPKYLSSRNDGLVYGNITLTLNKGNFVTATFGYDTYDFDMKEWGVSTFYRNTLTKAGSIYAGEGTPYRIYFYGTQHIE